jgi:hypothetical protein
VLRWRLTGAVFVAVSSALVVAVAASCSSFGSAETPGEASTDGAPSAEASLDAASDSAAADGGATCGPATVLDFEPPETIKGFTVQKSSTGATVGIVPSKGVDGGAAVEVVLNVPDAFNDGPYGLITRSFDLTSPGLTLELSFDYTAPTAQDLYVANGCSLSFRSTANSNTPRTDIGTSWNGLSGPFLQADSTLADGGAAPPSFKAERGLDLVGPGFHHLTLAVDLAKDGQSAVARFTNTAGQSDTFTFPLVAVPTHVVVACGMYADSAAIDGLTAYTDNVRFAICSTK